MATPYLSEIKLFSFNFPPKGWALCNGQLLQINQNPALFALLGTNYGGNGTSTFALPNLQGRVPLHMGEGRVLGESSGEENHTLLTAELPTHVHALQASSANGDTAVPAGHVLSSVSDAYGPANELSSLNSTALANDGASQSHENKMPFLVLNFCIALSGIFPTQE
jgi:microcystin-dependent protein